MSVSTSQVILQGANGKTECISVGREKLSVKHPFIKTVHSATINIFYLLCHVRGYLILQDLARKMGKKKEKRRFEKWLIKRQDV